MSARNAAINELSVRVHGRDYTYVGTIVSIFKKRSGKVRCVIEDAEGRLFIHNADNLLINSDEELWKLKQYIDK